MSEDPPKRVVPLRFRLVRPADPHAEGTSGGRDEQINAAFQEVLRRQSELSSAIDLLRSAISTSPSPSIGIGHNQGPPIQIEELDADNAQLLALLKETGPKPATPADHAPIFERAEKMLTLSERISAWSRALAAEGGKLGAREVAKKLSAPLWEEVARRIADLYHAIKIWLSLSF